MSSSNCCFLTCIQISQEAGQVVWYSHLFQNFPQLIVWNKLKFCSHANYLLIGKGVREGCILSPCLFNFYAEYIMRNAGLEEAQAGIKIAGRNMNNLRYAEDTTLKAESEEELKSL